MVGRCSSSPLQLKNGLGVPGLLRGFIVPAGEFYGFQFGRGGKQTRALVNNLQ
jgi:hypothetical protein